jgi:hypothetical protein
MRDQDYEAILTDCLERLQRGETIAACLARHPQHASVLEPVLVAASALIRTSAFRMPEPARAQARARMRRALAVQATTASPVAGWWKAGWLRRGLAAMAAVFLLVVLIGSPVAASRPGDWGYPIRAAVERVPATFASNPKMRARAELRAADRRLADLQGSTVRGNALRSGLTHLLAGDEAAYAAALPQPQSERADIAVRLAGHAAAMEQLAQSAGDPGDAKALRAAVQRASALALMLQPVSHPERPVKVPAGPTARPGRTETPAPPPHTSRPLTATIRPPATRAAQGATLSPRATDVPDRSQVTSSAPGTRATPTVGDDRSTGTPIPGGMGTPGSGQPGHSGGSDASAGGGGEDDSGRGDGNDDAGTGGGGDSSGGGSGGGR